VWDEETLRAPVPTVLQGIIRNREWIEFMAVARAMVLKAHACGDDESRRMAERLGISRQTRHNWLKRDDVIEWQAIWARRLASLDPKAAPPTVVRRTIADSEWRWIARVLAEFGGRSWDLKRAAVEREANRPGSGMKHLEGIHRATLFRKRALLTTLGEELRQERLAAQRAQLSRSPSQSLVTQSGVVEKHVVTNERSFSAANLKISEPD
jgi:hypothetical protein